MLFGVFAPSRGISRGRAAELARSDPQTRVSGGQITQNLASNRVLLVYAKVAFQLY